MLRGQKQTGFTIVELLIVIVVIGILAAITIVAFNGVQNRANDAAVKSNLAAFSKKYELFKVDSAADKYPFGNSATGLDSIPTPVSKNAYDTSVSYNLLNCTSSANPGSDYAMLAISKSGKRFWVGSQSNGVQEYTGSDTWGPIGMCTSVLTGSIGNGAGWSSGGGGWRPWVS